MSRTLETRRDNSLRGRGKWSIHWYAIPAILELQNIPLCKNNRNYICSFQVSAISISLLNAAIVNTMPMARPSPFFNFFGLFANSAEPEYLTESDEITADYLDDDDIAPEDLAARPPSEARSVDFKKFPFLSQLLYTFYEILGRSSIDENLHHFRYQFDRKSLI